MTSINGSSSSRRAARRPRARDAAKALKNLAFNSDNNKVAIAKAGGIAPLVALARDGTNGQKTEAAAALRNLSLNKTSLAAMKDLRYGKKSGLFGWKLP